MTFLITFLVTLAVCCALREPIRKYPWVFYVLAVVVAVMYFLRNAIGFPHAVDMVLLKLLGRGFVMTALFVIVMFIGVFPKGGKIRKFFQPMRGPISIVACILGAAHMIPYLMNFVPKLFGKTDVMGNVFISTLIAIILFILAIVLGGTSFIFVKRHMKGKTWKGIQRWAYLMYALIYVHLVLMLIKSAMGGGAAAIQSIVIYSVFFIGYVAARIYTQKRDKASGMADVIVDENVGAEVK